MLDDFICTPLSGDSSPYLLAKPKHSSTDLKGWARNHREQLEAALLLHKAILFRGFPIEDEGRFGEFARTLFNPVEYVYRSTKRTHIGKNVYTATEYPSDQAIPVHCENSYQRRWPAKIFFYCKTPPLTGGATPLANVEAVTSALPPDLKQIFQQRKVSYVRNYGTGIDLPWQVVFQSSDKAEVERYCLENGIQFVWRTGGALQTRQVRPAMATHPKTGVPLWFNQAHLFHVSGLADSVRLAMEQIFRPADLPRNAYFGDGTPIEEELLDCIRKTYERCTTVFDWQQNDVLAVDNMAVAHGRSPYTGPRRVLVAMGDLIDGDFEANGPNLITAPFIK